MRATGIVRRVDDLGRIVIPKEIRRSMDIRDGEALEIYTTNDGCVVLQKYEEGNDKMPEIFNEGGKPAELPTKTDRKNIVIHDRNSNGDYYLRLTDDQIKLLDYLIDEYIVDGNYEVIESHTFKVV